MENHKTQICIVGAGPSGAITSLLLAKKGIKSILLDKQVFPRHKACGDNVSGNAIRILKEIDPSLLNGLASNNEAVRLEGMYAYSYNCDKIKIPYKSLETEGNETSCFGIARIDFDNHLMQLAKQNEHITVLENFSVSKIDTSNNKAVVYERNGTTVTSNVVVLAAGSNSKLCQYLCKSKIGIKHTAIGIRGYFSGVNMPYQNYCDLYLNKEIMPGGAYLTPLPNGLVNVNVVVRMDQKKKNNIDLKEILNEFVALHPVFKERFENAKQVGNLEGSILNLGTKKRKIAGNNYIMVGDSAGLIDLLSANGLPQAFVSARIAAKYLEKAVEIQDFSEKVLMAYHFDVHKATKNYLKLGRMVAPLFKFQWLTALIGNLISFFAKHNSENKAVQDVMYSDNLLKLLITPKFYGKLIFGVKNKENL